MNKDQLHKIFSNSDCFSEAKLIAYTKNQLSNIERNEVEQHAINCKFCSDSLEGFKKYPNSINAYKTTKVLFNNKSNSNKSLIITITGIAASVIISFFLLNNNSNSKNAKNKPSVTDLVDSISLRKSAPITKPKEKVHAISDSLKLFDLKTDSIIKRSKQLNKSMVKTNRNKNSRIKLNNTLNDDNIKELFDEEEFVVKNNLIEVENSSKQEFRETTFQRESDFVVEKSPNISQDDRASIQQEKNEEKKVLEGKDIKTISNNSLNSAENIDNYDSDLVISEISNETLYSIQDTVKNIGIDYEFSEIKEIKKTENKNKILQKTHQVIIDSTSIELVFIEGIRLFNNKSYKDAITKLSEVKKSDTEFFNAQLHIGKSYLKLKDNIKAKPFLESALKGNKKVKIEAQLILNSIK